MALGFSFIDMGFTADCVKGTQGREHQIEVCRELRSGHGQSLYGQRAISPDAGDVGNAGVRRRSRQTHVFPHLNRRFLPFLETGWIVRRVVYKQDKSQSRIEAKYLPKEVEVCKPVCHLVSALLRSL